MKRFILIMSCLLLSITSYAQLNVQSEMESFNKIGSLRSTYAYLYNQGTTYLLGIRTTNQFDKGCFFALGETAESSILTANDLISASESMEENASLQVLDAEGTEAYIIKKTMLGKPYLIIKMAGKAGESNITVPELKKAIKMIKEHASIE